MASSSAVFDIEAGGTGQPPAPTVAADIILPGRRFRRRSILLVAALAMIAAVVGTATLGGGSDRGGAQIAAVEALLASPDTAAASLEDGVLPLTPLWALRADQPAQTLVMIDSAEEIGELRAQPLDGDQWIVGPLEGGEIMRIGEVPLVAIVVRDTVDGPIVDLAQSYLRARARTFVTDASPVPATPVGLPSPEEATRAYVAALLGGDGQRLAAITAPDLRASVLRYPETFAHLSAGSRSFVVTDVQFQISNTTRSDELHVAVNGLSAVSFDDTPLEVSLVGGCVTAAPPGTAEPDAGDCLFRGIEALGRPLPLDIVVVQGANGWRVDHQQTEAAAWSAVGSAGPEGVELVAETLQRWGLASDDFEPTYVPLPEGAVPPAPSTTVPPSITPPATSLPPGTTPQPVTTGPISGRLPSSPLGAIPLSNLSGSFDAAHLASMGMVGTAADLADFGFVEAVGTAWQEGGDGVFVLVLHYSSVETAAAEFDVFHGGAVSLGGGGVARYGPGDFSGPTDRGAGVIQYRVVLLSGTDHIVVETWGEPSAVETRAETLLNSLGG